MVREGRVIKIVGRPVKFLDKIRIEEIFQIDYDGGDGGVFESLDDFFSRYLVRKIQK